MGVSYKYGSPPLVRISILPRPYVHQQYCNIGILTAEATLEIRYNIWGSKWYKVEDNINRDLYRLWENSPSVSFPFRFTRTSLLSHSPSGLLVPPFSSTLYSVDGRAGEDGYAHQRGVSKDVGDGFLHYHSALRSTFCFFFLLIQYLSILRSTTITSLSPSVSLYVLLPLFLLHDLTYRLGPS